MMVMFCCLGRSWKCQPMNVWKGIDIRILIPNDIHRDALIDIMSSSDFKTMVGKAYSKK